MTAISEVPPPMSMIMLPRGVLDRDAHADGGRHGLGHQVDLAGPGLLGRLQHRALLHLGDAGGHAHHDAGPEEEEGVFLGDLDEPGEQALHHLEVRDHAVLHGTHRDDFAGGAAQHALGLGPDGQDLVGASLHGHDRGFVDDDSPPADVDQGVRGAEIDADIAGKEAKQGGGPPP